MQQSDATCQVIEDQQRGRRNKRGVRNAGLRFGIAREFFKQANHIVAGHADESACKRQIVVGFGPRRERQHLAQRCKIFVLISRPRLRLAVDDKRRGIHANLDRVAEAQERIARQSFAAFHALQQEARPHGLELQERRNRRIQVGGDVKRCLHK